MAMYANFRFGQNGQKWQTWSKNGQKMAKMAENDQKWSKMTKEGYFGKKWPKNGEFSVSKGPCMQIFGQKFQFPNRKFHFWMSNCIFVMPVQFRIAFDSFQFS